VSVSAPFEGLTNHSETTLTSPMVEARAE